MSLQQVTYWTLRLEAILSTHRLRRSFHAWVLVVQVLFLHQMALTLFGIQRGVRQGILSRRVMTAMT